MAKQEVVVNVTPGHGITVTPNAPVRVRRNVDTIEWRSSQQFGIVIPRNEPQPQCSQQGGVYICVAGPFGGDRRTIKYDVTAPNTPTLDPDIEVIPDSLG